MSSNFLRQANHVARNYDESIDVMLIESMTLNAKRDLIFNFKVYLKGQDEYRNDTLTFLPNGEIKETGWQSDHTLKPLLYVIYSSVTHHV